MREADILLCNNEFCLSDRGSPLPGKPIPSGQSRRMPPTGTPWERIWSRCQQPLRGLRPDAFLDTLYVLKDAGIPYIGAGQNLAEAQQAQYLWPGT